MGKKRTSKGFTLVEMLITVAIIGILATIAVPSYMHYIERGKLAQAHNELVNINNLIKKARIKSPSKYRDQASQLKALIADNCNPQAKETEGDCIGIDKEIAGKNTGKYVIDVSMSDEDKPAYQLEAVPKANSGYKKALWMSSEGDAYKCENAEAAKRHKKTGDCEKIGG